jgi:hypothetical protein
MNIRTAISVILGMSAIGLLLWMGAYAHDNIIIAAPTESQPEADMTAFLVAKPNLVVNGTALARVEVWAVPEGDRVTENDHELLGNVSLHAGSPSSTQIWSMPIPAESVAAVEIYARSFDGAGRVVGQMSLPYLGVSQIYEFVWKDQPASIPSTGYARSDFSIALRVGEKRSIGGLGIELTRIINDSRCPMGAICVWAGEVEVQVRLSVDDQGQTVNLRSAGPSHTFGNYRISIGGVEPTRTQALPTEGDYRITFEVQRT